MGERLEEINLNEVLKENPEDLESLKSICSQFGRNLNILPCIVGELKYISEEEIPEFFLDKRIILSQKIDGGYLILINPEIEKKILGKTKILYSDPYLKETWAKKATIPLSEITEPGQFLEKMAELDDATRMQKNKESAQKAFRDSVKGAGIAAKKIAGGTKTVETKVAVPVAKGIGHVAKKAGKGIVNHLDSLDPDQYEY